MHGVPQLCVCAGSVDLDTLIRQAEQQMYQAKEEHYRIQRQLEH